MSSGVVFHHSVKFSLHFALSLLALHMMAMVVVFVVALPWQVKLAMFMLVILSLAYHLARDVLLLLPESWCDIPGCDQCGGIPRVLRPSQVCLENALSRLPDRYTP